MSIGLKKPEKLTNGILFFEKNISRQADKNYGKDFFEVCC